MNTKSHRIELRYFTGCPHAGAARSLLRTCLNQLGLQLPIEEKEGDYPSPTIVIDGVDVTGAVLGAGRYCRVDRPTKAQVMAALQRIPVDGVDQTQFVRKVDQTMTCLSTTTSAAEHTELDDRTVRATALRRGLLLEFMTVGWNVVEGVTAVVAATKAGSIALLAFGVDSFVECASGSILIWRLSAERRTDSRERIEELEHSARRLVAVSLFLLAAYVAFDAVKALVTGERPESSVVGIFLTAVSVAVMFWLAAAKRRAADALKSSALRADAAQTMACWHLSLATLAGVGLNSAFGWWWADPAAALVIAALVVREGREAWEGHDCC